MTKITSYTDGGSRRNPGPAACGIVLYDEQGKILLTDSKFLGVATNNEAEYGALILALQKARELLREKPHEMVCHLDSELVVKQLNGVYRVKEAKMKKLFGEVQKLKANFDHIAFIHVRREHNKLADKLVNEELDRQEKI